MSTIFPADPDVNDEYQGYRYNGTSWDIIGQEYNPTVYSGTEPSNAKAGDIWIDSSTDVPSISPETILTTTVAASTYQPIVSGVSSTEIGYLDGVTSAVQTQLNAKASLSGATFTGNVTAPEVSASTKLVANAVGGDEGGEILLGKPATNTTLTGTGVTIDVFQNRLRIFEQGGNARGVSIDISNTSNGVGTELTPGLGGVPFRMAAGIATVGSNSPVSVTFPASRFSVAPVVTVTGNSGWAWISNLTSTGVVVYQTTSWGGASQAGSMYWTAVQMTSGAAGG
jgi:hypothetical protein